MPEVLSIIREFKVAYQIDNYLFTHAGVSQKWYDEHTQCNEYGRYFEITRENKKTIIYKSSMANFLNQMYEESYEPLLRVDGLRRNRFVQDHGGCLWLDKYHLERSILKGYHQIVGHTQIDSIISVGNDKSSVTFIDLGDKSSIYEISITIDENKLN